MNLFLAFAIALTLDWLISWPRPLFDRIGHPVTWIGKIITWCDAHFNQGGAMMRFWKGALSSGLLLIFMCAIALMIMELPSWFLPLFIWPLLGARSLYDHVFAVLIELESDNLEGARASVAMIVGRNPESLNEAEIRRAAIESLAENTSDGVIAPIFWGLLLKLPGLFVYKTANTLDSMIGYRNEKYEYYGKFAARLDDVINLIPARITAILFALTAGRLDVLKGLGSDARKHRSPNAGWPEAAIAHALGFRLSGPRIYHGKKTEDKFVNEGADDPENTDLAHVLTLYKRMIWSLIVLFYGVGIWLCWH